MAAYLEEHWVQAVTTEEAKAVQEVAKLGGKLVDATTGFGGWLAEIVGDSPKNLFGLVAGDWIDHQRRRNLMYLQRKTDRIRAEIGAGVPVEPAVSVVVPLLQAAADESREELQDLWAALLASALQGGGEKRVRRSFFDTLKALEPVDALMLAGIARLPPDETVGRLWWMELPHKIGISEGEKIVSIHALQDLRLIEPGTFAQTLTFYGKAFWRACNPQPEP